MSYQLNNHFTLLVTTSNNYLDILPIFFISLQKFWPEFNYNTVVVAENKITSLPYQFKYFNETNITWSSRILSTLKEIKTDYILFCMEDYLLSKKIPLTEIYKIENFILNNNIDYYRLVNIPFKIHFHKNVKINRYYAYCLSLQVAYWKKEFLINLLENNEFNPWEVEQFLNELSKKKNFLRNKKIYNSYKSFFENVNAVIKGKYTLKAITFFKKNNFLYNQNRKILSRKDSRLIFLKKIGTILIPVFLRKIIKKLLSRFGFTFTTNV